MIGAALGATAGLAGHTLELIGLYDLVAGLAGGFALVALAHLVGERRAAVHFAAAALLGVTWLGAYLVTDAFTLRELLIRRAADAGVLLGDEAIVRGDDDPAALIDDTLLAETGSRGLRGAARLRLQRGLRVLQVAERARVVPMPAWLHALALAARAALVAILVARALAAAHEEPSCARCGEQLERREAARFDAADADRAAALLAERDEAGLLSLAATKGAANGGFVLLADRCPGGHSARDGYELRRLRGRAFAPTRAGRIAIISPQLADSLRS